MRFAYLIEPPFNYLSENGDVTGCDVELIRTVLNTLGIDTIEFIETEFSQLLPGLAAYRWDITTGLFDTAERRKIATFSRPIWALPNGLLIKKGNPAKLTGYRSVAQDASRKMVVIRDQLQHQATIEACVPANGTIVCETYDEAMQAVRDGRADAYASVAMAHTGFLEQHPQLRSELETISIPSAEKTAARGAFGFRLSDTMLRNTIDAALTDYLGSPEHRRMMRSFGFEDEQVDLIVSGNA